VGLASLFVDLGARPADGDGGTAMTLVRCDELDAAVTVAVVVPVHKCRYPLASLLLDGERSAIERGDIFPGSGGSLALDGMIS